ncbi:IS30 family transposase [Methylorubrum rhodinum]|uniref:IS30 family transposase n=1 Tax=Methylorubrum rhodinum TaxID=29428 RepID=A0A840ZL34_9HYPH|nr:helix-turn-helix domain-containing protein [Methylorubrum rhodinum]MBB5758822.1 IS30 family transposase [Methylorubrum rhodinum]
MRAQRPVLGSQRKLWRSQDAEGVSVKEIARRAGRHSATVSYHLERRPLEALRANALRIERFFAACNRAVAEAGR